MESNGTVLAGDAVPSLQVYVMSTVVAMPDDPREPLVYRGEYMTYPEITEGKNGSSEGNCVVDDEA